MASTYHINTGAVYEETKGPSSQTVIFRLRRILVRPLYFLICIVFFGGITWYVFTYCVEIEIQDGKLFFPLEDRISTGALFATFGSAVISVCTLLANQRLTRAYEDRDILMTELCADELENIPWRRWQFVPRASVQHISRSRRYIGLRNASISFHTKTCKKTFSIPTTEMDFKELPLLRSWIHLKYFRGQYLRDLIDLGENDFAEYMTWDCITDIYESALLYRFCSRCVEAGCLFVFLSILFVILYPTLYQQFAPTVIG